jgi:hypothetical protein
MSHLLLRVIAVESVRVTLNEDLACRSWLHFTMSTVPDVAFIAFAVEPAKFVETRSEFAAGMVPRDALILITDHVEASIAVRGVIPALKNGTRCRAVRVSFANLATARLAIV